ncbi:hypothetical protein COB52_00270 [Candidatus Kaiserbacteria bacterium]|nr:MAG: hypothetical protein COB52_00270 [Candidatus Kaiserbacteria bacterium]
MVSGRRVYCEDSDKFKGVFEAAKVFNKVKKSGEGELVFADVVEDKKGSEETPKEEEDEVNKAEKDK